MMSNAILMPPANLFIDCWTCGQQREFRRFLKIGGRAMMFISMGLDGKYFFVTLQVEPPAAMGVGGGVSGGCQTGLNPSPVGNTPISTDCSGCGELITDRFILQVAGRSWHGHCLRCVVCHSLLDGHASCFLKDEQLYCKLDYTK